MSDLHVGGIYLKNRFKTLEDAVEKARVNDIIHLHKDVIVSGVQPKVSLTINGNGKEIKVLDGKAGFYVDSAISLTFMNVKMRLGAKANMLNVDTDGSKLKLDTVELQYVSKIDPRDWYTPFLLKEDTELAISASKLAHFWTLSGRTIVDGSVIGSLFNKYSKIDADELEITNSELSNIRVVSYGSYIEGVETYGRLTIATHENGVADVTNVLIKKLSMTEREYRKSFKDSALFYDSLYGLIFENGSIEVDGLHEEEGETPYRLEAVHTVDTSIEFDHDETLSGHSAVNSAVSTTSEHEWELDADSQLTNPNTVGAGESSAYQKIQELIGLDSVKNQLNLFLSTARIQAEQKRRGITESTSFINHMVFAGPAGTGKTTVAHLLAEALVEEHVLRENKVVVVGAEDLVSKWVGETKTKTHNVILSALGGILFIDEAYSLLPRGENSHNQDAVDQIVEDATKYKDDLIIIMAGYDTDMRNFMDNANTGLNSRFTHWIDFEPYTFENLLEILKLKTKNSGTIMSADTFRFIAERLLMVYRSQAGKNGLDGNGRYIENLLRDLLNERNARIAKEDLAKLTNDDLLTVLTVDAEKAMTKRLSNPAEYTIDKR